MTLMILGLILFWITHLLKIKAPSTRAALAEIIGEPGTKALMAALTLGSMALMVLGYQSAAFTNIWYPPALLIHINNLLMLLAVLFFTTGNFKSFLRTRVRHPQLAAAKTWALAHLLVNGDLASIILFGGILAWAVVAMIGSNKRDGNWERPAPGTVKGNLFHIVTTVVLVGVIGFIHTWAGVNPFAGGGE